MYDAIRIYTSKLLEVLSVVLAIICPGVSSDFSPGLSPEVSPEIQSKIFRCYIYDAYWSFAWYSFSSFTGNFFFRRSEFYLGFLQEFNIEFVQSIRIRPAWTSFAARSTNEEKIIELGPRKFKLNVF